MGVLHSAHGHCPGPSFSVWFLFIYLFGCARVLAVACGNLVPQPGIEPRPRALEVWSCSHWTSREAPGPSWLAPDLLLFPSSVSSFWAGSFSLFLTLLCGLSTGLLGGLRSPLAYAHLVASGRLPGAVPAPLHTTLVLDHTGEASARCDLAPVSALSQPLTQCWVALCTQMSKAMSCRC